MARIPNDAHWLLASPILSAIDRFGGVEFLPFPKVNRLDDTAVKRTIKSAQKAVERMRLRGKIEFFHADAFCIEALGLHPVQVYGPEWYGVDDPACAILYVAPEEKARMYSLGVAA